jgi:hypothetical protein
LLERAVEAPASAREQDLQGDAGASNGQRAQRLEQLLRSLRDKSKVVWDEQAVRDGLSDPAVLGPGT